MVGVKKEEEKLIIGVTPKLIINLKTQQNLIQTPEMTIAYPQKVVFSEDLLSGKRPCIFQTAINYHYQQACQMYEGVKIAKAYQPFANTTIKEIKKI